jgi:hypothetical protein
MASSSKTDVIEHRLKGTPVASMDHRVASLVGHLLASAAILGALPLTQLPWLGKWDQFEVMALSCVATTWVLCNLAAWHMLWRPANGRGPVSRCLLMGVLVGVASPPLWVAVASVVAVVGALGNFWQP